MPPNTQGSVNVLVNPVVNTQAWNRVARQFPLGKISADLNQFQASLDASVARTGAFAISAGALGGTARIIRDLTASFIEVQKTLTEINSIFGLSKRAIGDFGKDLFNVARQTASSFEDVSAAAQEFARQGLSVTETAKRTADAMTLAKLSGIETAAAVQTLTAAVNGFSKEAVTTTNIVDKLATVDAAFAVSTQDLAAGLSRVGDVAQGAGVSLDELLAAVTAVQQRTSRGGAVIGNGLKSIFTRLQRSNVRESLESLGVATTNAAGEFRGAIPILDEYAKKYSSLTDAQRAFADEQIAGVYQINTLKALLSDMSSEYGSFANAVDTASESSGSAARRLAELSTTTSALVSRTATSLKEFGAVAGEDLLGTAITRSLTAIDYFSKNIKEKLSGEDVSAFGQITKRVFEDLGKFIGGPGLAAGILIIGTLFARVAGDAGRAIKSVAQTITGAQKYKDVAESIVRTVQSDVSLQKDLARVRGNRIAEEQTILSYLRQQAQVTAEIAALQARVIPNIAARAQFSGKGRSQQVVGYKAGGYVNTAPEQMMIAQGVGGARKGDRPKIIKNFNYGNGKRGTVVANTGEYFVPNFGGGSAIFNRDMVKQYGLPKGAKKINAASGYVPNFALKGKLNNRGLDSLFAALQQDSYPYIEDATRSITKPAELRKYLMSLGYRGNKGSSRTFFNLGNGRGVKVPHNEAGMAQSMLENSILFRDYFAEQHYSSLLPKGFVENETSGAAIIESLAKPKAADFRKYAKVNKANFLKKGRAPSDFEYQVEDFTGNFGLLKEDFIGGTNIGLGKNGLKLLDIGYNQEIRDQFYKKPNGKGGFYKDLGRSVAGGYTPLSKAIAREASVRPKSSIRINQSPSLASGTNPLGLAVTNTIDEPRGLLDVPNRGRGYVPNYADINPQDYAKNLWDKLIPQYLQELKAKNADPKLIAKFEQAIEESQFGAEYLDKDQKKIRNEISGIVKKDIERKAELKRLSSIKDSDIISNAAPNLLGKGSTTAGYAPPTARKAQEQIKTAAEATKQATSEAKKATETIKKETKTRAKVVKQKEEVVAKEEKVAKEEQKVVKVRAKKVKDETKTAASEEKAAKQSISKKPKKKQSSLTPDGSGNFVRKDGVRVDAKGRVLPKIKSAQTTEQSLIEELMTGSSKGGLQIDLSQIGDSYSAEQFAKNFDPKRNTAFGRDASKKTRISAEDYDKYTNNSAEEKKKAAAKKIQEKIDKDNLRAAERAKLNSDRVAKKAAADAARAANESKRITDKLNKEAARKAAQSAKQAAADAARIARQTAQSQRQKALQASQQDALLTRTAKSYINPRQLGIIVPRTADEQAVRDRRAELLQEERKIINANRRKEKRREQWSQEEQARQEAQEAIQQIAEQKEKLRERVQRRRQVPRPIGPMTPEQQREYNNQRRARARELRRERARRPENRDRGIGGFLRRNQTPIGALTFLAPSLIGAGIDSLRPEFDESRSVNADEIRSNRRISGGMDVATQSIQGALTGALFGPWGALAGAATGAAISLTALVKSTDELTIRQTVAQNQLSKITTAISANEIVRGSKRQLDEARKSGNTSAITNAQNAYVESLTLASKELDAADFNKLALAITDEDFQRTDVALRYSRNVSEANNLSIAAQKSFGGKDFNKDILALNQSVRGYKGIPVLNTPINNPIDSYEAVTLGDLLNKNRRIVGPRGATRRGFDLNTIANEKTLGFAGTTEADLDGSNIRESEALSRAKKDVREFLEVLGKEVPEYAGIAKNISEQLDGSQKQRAKAVESFKELILPLKNQAEIEEFAKKLESLNSAIQTSSVNVGKLRSAISSNFETTYSQREFAGSFRQNLLSKTSSNIDLLEQGGLINPKVGNSILSRIREEQALISARSQIDPQILTLRDAISGLPNLGDKQNAIQSRIDSIAALNPRNFSESDAQLGEVNSLINELVNTLAPEQSAELKKIVSNITNVSKSAQQSLQLEEEGLKSQKRFSDLVARAQVSRNYGDANVSSDKEAISVLKDKGRDINARLRRKDAFSQLFPDRSILSDDLQQNLSEADRKSGILGRLSAYAGQDITGKNSAQIKTAIGTNIKDLNPKIQEAIKEDTLKLMEEYGKDYRLSFTESLKAVMDEEIKIREQNNAAQSKSNAISTPNAASGYLAMGKELDAIRKGVGGARNGDRPYVISKFNYGNGKRGPIVANTGEKHIKGSGADSILNREMMNAADGYISKYGIDEQIPEEYRKEFDDKITSLLEKAREKYGRIDEKLFKEWAGSDPKYINDPIYQKFLGPSSIKFGDMSRAAAQDPLAFFDRAANSIILDKEKYNLAPGDFLNNVLPHEVAHYIQRKQFNGKGSAHGKEFIEVLKVLGLNEKEPGVIDTTKFRKSNKDLILEANRVNKQKTIATQSDKPIKNALAEMTNIKSEKTNKNTSINSVYKYVKDITAGLNKYSYNKGAASKSQINNLSMAQMPTDLLQSENQFLSNKSALIQRPGTKSFTGTTMRSMGYWANEFLKESDGEAQSQKKIGDFKSVLDSLSRNDTTFAKKVPAILDQFKSGNISGAKDIFDSTNLGKASKPYTLENLTRLKNNQDYDTSVRKQFSFLDNNKNSLAIAAGLPAAAKNDNSNNQAIIIAIESLNKSIADLAEKLKEVEKEKLKNEKERAEIIRQSEDTTKKILEGAAKNGIILNMPSGSVNINNPQDVKVGGKKAPSPGGPPIVDQP